MILKKLSPSDLGETGQRAVNIPKGQENIFGTEHLKNTSKLPNEDYDLVLIEKSTSQKYKVVLSYKPGSDQWRIIGLSNNKEFFKKQKIVKGAYFLIHSSNTPGKLFFETQRKDDGNNGGQEFVDFLLIYFYLIEQKTFRFLDEKVYQVTNQNGSKSQKRLKSFYDITDSEKQSFENNEFSKEYNSSKDKYRNALDILKKYFPQVEHNNEAKNTNILQNNSPKLDIKNFQSDCERSGLIYSNQLITRYISSLATKPFVLLSGLSGSGKTKLAEAFAKWICESEEQYALIPVGADWTNREPLLGYPNALKDNEYVKPDNDALDLLIRAKDDETKPYFLILDEMNLSHVERYFADFLSTMESKNFIPLHKMESEINEIPKKIKLPENLFIVGTVNIDETTYMFSPKVLDRANTIEFRVSDTDISDFLEEPKDIDLEKLNGKGTSMATNFIDIAKGKKEKEEKINYKLKDTQQKIVNKFFKELQKSGAEFGYRTAFEISKLIYKLEEFGLSDENDKLDIAIMQKMLPKLHGSRTKLTRTLKPLAKLCLVTVNDKFDKEYFENFENIDFKEDKNIKYKLSFEKIMRMYKNAVENGFASYAEA
jgi:hypothetical protein